MPQAVLYASYGGLSDTNFCKFVMHSEVLAFQYLGCLDIYKPTAGAIPTATKAVILGSLSCLPGRVWCVPAPQVPTLICDSFSAP